MRWILALSLIGISYFPADAQVFSLTREQMMAYTSQNPYDRFEDGRPKVPEEILEQVKELVAEDAWGVLSRSGYPNQFEGNWQVIHPGKKLVGRVITAQFMPLRPDVRDVVEADAKQRGLGRNANQRVIDMLQPGDVLVVDLFGKIEQGTFVGDNLAAAVFSATGTGFVVDGAIRDLEGIHPMNIPGYVRGFHPSAIGNVMLTGINIPVRIGDVTVMPGDVVLGDREGIYFIPPHLVQKVVDQAEDNKIHDEWTKMKFMTGRYQSSQLYPRPSDPELIKEYEEYRKKRLAEMGK
jgi:4-hydroxy-4-methyl-2-oxoglutarate aldolase